MVEKTTSENKLAKKTSTAANVTQDAIIQKTQTDSKEAKKAGVTVKPDTQETDVSVTDFPMALEEFCTRLSQDKNQVELIGGFYAHEKSAHKKLPREKWLREKSSGEKGSQHLMDTDVNFKARFDDFCQRPVES